MNDLENRLRESFQHQVETPPTALSYADSAIARGRRVRRTRVLTAGVAGVALAAGVLVLAVPGASSRSVAPLGSSAPATNEPSADPSQPPESVASHDWLSRLSTGTEPALGTVALAGDRALFPGAAATVDGIQQVVYAATLLRHGELLVSTGASSGQKGRLLVLSPDGSSRVLAEDVNQGHAVDPSGTKVAFGYEHSGEDVVMDLATGHVLAQTSVDDPAGSGRPVAWVGDRVVMTVGDGGAVFAKVWDTAVGTVRTIGPEARYYGAEGGVPGTDLVALDTSDGSCFGVSHLDQSGDLWQTCDGFFGGFSPDGQQVLARYPGNAAHAVRVLDAQTGAAAGTVDLPADGVLAVGWSTVHDVAAVVRVPGAAGARPSVIVVTCPTDGGACSARGDVLPDTDTAFLPEARG